MIKLDQVSGNTFIRLGDDGDQREPWVFEPGEDGKTTHIVRHSGIMSRVE